MKQRNIALCILFSILTCGIYSIYWFVVLTDELNAAAQSHSNTDGGLALLFSIITCGIYTFYWMYKMGKNVEIIHNRHNLPNTNAPIIYVVLSIFGLSIVSFALMQNELNEYGNYV